MKNITAMNSWKFDKKDNLVLQRNAVVSQLAPAVYMYGDNSDELCGTLYIMDDLESASIEALRQDIQDQRGALKIGIDKHGKAIDFDSIHPWDEERFLVCKEGVFLWDWETENYIRIGMVKGTEKRKTVSLKKDLVVHLVESDFRLERGTSYDLVGEYVTYSESLHPVVMLVIHQHRCVPLAVPYYRENIMIHNHDYVDWRLNR
ncbi:hypothetical protein [Brevibacillus choshinensis]|uniref:Uncharacterized protein n=1 Tax=Brevibacillus choshinensis TaxID=54911 RepID=A0ABX7FIM0_BRECH|nr:hypothetical protein [Brevibacillus choshinensis]QRG65987.1 hypothetical protein JNE38_20735 [Brevibacillus choshinensis]